MNRLLPCFATSLVPVLLLASGCGTDSKSNEQSESLPDASAPVSPGPSSPSATSPSTEDSEDAGETDAPQSSDDETDPLFGGGTPIEVGAGGAGNGGDDPEPVPEPPLQRCEEAKATGEWPLIDDFESGTNSTLQHDGRGGSWYQYNSVEDPAHTLEWISDPSSPGGADGVLYSVGGGYEWAGVGMGFRWSANQDGDTLNCVYDASVYEGVRFWARGNGSARLTISVPGAIPVENGGTCESGCWANHGVDVVFGEDWGEYVFSFSEFVQPSWGEQLGPLDPTQLRTMQFEFPANSDFVFWLDDMSFYDGATPTPSPEGGTDEPTDPETDEPTDPETDDPETDDPETDEPTDPPETDEPDAGVPEDGGS